MDIEYVDILTVENLSLIQVANMDLIYWSVRLCSRRGGEGKRGWMGGNVMLASQEYHIIRVYENLVQHPSNHISIFPFGQIYPCLPPPQHLCMNNNILVCWAPPQYFSTCYATNAFTRKEKLVDREVVLEEKPFCLQLFHH